MPGSSSAAKTRTRLSPEARKNQLLDVSKDMIIEHGLQEFSIEALARTAQVSSPLVYTYFDSRLDVLRSLLAREYLGYTTKLMAELEDADSFETVVRLNVESNFDHFAAGNIIPILESQPEIASVIQSEAEAYGRKLARYLVRAAADTYKLNKRQAELLVKMSSGASIAAAQYASLGRMSRQTAVDAAHSYIIAGLERSAEQ